MLIRIAFMILLLGAYAAPAAASYETGLYAYSAGDFDTAYREWLNLAETGDARSQYQVGLMHLNGEGITVDAAQAFTWFRTAADQGYVPALVQLAALYYSGLGGAHDHDKAASLYLQAADQSNTEAQYALGTLHIRGHGVEKDLVKAHMWLSLAAMRGLKIARTRQGEIESQMTAMEITEADALRDKKMGY